MEEALVTTEPGEATPAPLIKRDFTVIATNQQEMAAAQAQLVEVAESRLEECRKEIRDLTENLETAKKHKLKQSGIMAGIYKARRKEIFYEKLKAAFVEGFVLVPNMPMDVFAVRTTRKRPTGVAFDTEPSPNPIVKDQESNSPAIGDGQNVSIRPETYGMMPAGIITRKHDGAQIQQYKDWATDFRTEIDFPFALAKPRIVDLTTRAMALRIFDEIGVLPQSRKTDPMVIGRIFYKTGPYGQVHEASFLIAWFVETATL